MAPPLWSRGLGLGGFPPQSRALVTAWVSHMRSPAEPRGWLCLWLCHPSPKPYTSEEKKGIPQLSTAYPPPPSSYTLSRMRQLVYRLSKLIMESPETSHCCHLWPCHTCTLCHLQVRRGSVMGCTSCRATEHKVSRGVRI